MICRSCRCGSGFAVAAAIVLLAQVAHAAPGAKEAYAHGISLYQAGRYGAAAESFLSAYASQPKPMILFNVGQAYRKDGKFPEALQYYQRFLREASPAERAPLQNETERYVAEIEAHLALEKSLLERTQRDREEAARVERERHQAQPLQQPPGPQPQPRPAEVVTPVAPHPAVVTTEVEVSKPAPPRKKTPVHKTWWLWTVVGVAAAAVAVGVGVGVTQNADPGSALGTRKPVF